MNPTDQLLKDNAHLKRELQYAVEQLPLLRRLVEFSADMLILIDTDGQILEYNQAVSNATAYSRDALYGVHLNTLFGESAQYVMEAGFTHSEDAIRTVNGQVECLDGPSLTVEVGCKKFVEQDQMYLVLSVRDISDRIKQQRALNQAEEQLSALHSQLEMRRSMELQDRMECIGVLAGGVAHDLNNILSVVVGNIGLLKMDLEDEDGDLEAANDAMDGAMQARDVANRLLTFTKGGSTLRTPVETAVWLNRTAQAIMSGMPTSLVLDLPAYLPVIKIDETRVVQALTNLLFNAQQASEKNSHVRLSAALTTASETTLSLKQGNYIAIAVEDKGSGIHASIRDRVFEPFFTTKKEGRGLGLSSAYKIAIDHEGQLDFVTEINQGTTFTLYLPTETQPQAAVVPVDTIEMPTNLNILVMDDNPHISNSIRSILNRYGSTVTLAQNGEQAVRAFQGEEEQNNAFDVLILDLSVRSGEGGISALARMRSMNCKAPAIACSGYPPSMMEDQVKSLGFQSYLGKPFTTETLIASVCSVVEAQTDSGATNSDKV